METFYTICLVSAVLVSIIAGLIVYFATKSTWYTLGAIQLGFVCGAFLPFTFPILGMVVGLAAVMCNTGGTNVILMGSGEFAGLSFPKSRMSRTVRTSVGLLLMALLFGGVVCVELGHVNNS